MERDYCVVMVIVNNGFSEYVMEVARDCGVKGGTVISGRGTARQEAEEKYNITISPEKELVMILVKKNIRDDVLHALYEKIGIDSPGQGIAFTMPVDEVAGLRKKKDKKEVEEPSNDKKGKKDEK